jgi:cytochrome c-type biogenesis protein
MDGFLAELGTWIQSSPGLALLGAFVGGLLTASNPCVLAMIPLTMSFVAGQRTEESGVWRAFGFSSLFVVGLSISFTALGMFAALAGHLYGEVPVAWNWVVAAVCLVMGLHLVGAIPLKIPIPQGLQPKIRGPLGALVLGLLFGIVSMPCAGPILVVLLTYLAGSGGSVAWGGLLLLVYALGHSVLILVAGTSMGLARTLIENKKTTRVTAVMRRVAGVVIILVGVFFAWRGLGG